ncbi:hypothetical protein BCR34DRAFT_290879 [Clohesyomyces aquaticus]|uniref:Uncharacterized protein n=1 Tax=Clohesyomyces aquaticus TaxID=1231657 RepID=A0A1Y1ZRM6_9PLEO|nr:hypothetical protein BCR34DRAFT_290879 [Clohesyomyces aquaticus]
MNPQIFIRDPPIAGGDLHTLEEMIGTRVCLQGYGQHGCDTHICNVARTCVPVTICIYMPNNLLLRRGSGDGCYSPDDVYPQSRNRRPFTSLIWYKEYEITWETIIPNVPVTIWWLFDGDSNFTRLGTLQVRWETNVTSNAQGSFTFKASPFMFPIPLSPNITSNSVQGSITRQSRIYISQIPDRTLRNGTVVKDSAEGLQGISDSFIMNGRPSLSSWREKRGSESGDRSYRSRLG